MLIRNGATGVTNGDHDEDIDTSSEQNTDDSSKHYSCSRFWTTLLIVTILMMVVMIPQFISSTRISKGNMVIKNTTGIFSKGLASSNQKIDASTIDQSLVSSNIIKEEPICRSLDKNMAQLLSVLRGDEDQIGKNESKTPGTTTYKYGYLMPFASEQRFLPTTPTNVTITAEGNTQLVVVPGFNQELISRAFVGKRIYFIGDSTSRVLFVALRRLLLAIHEHDTDSNSTAKSSESSSTIYWRDGRWLRNLKADFQTSKHEWRKVGLAPYVFEKDGTYMELLDVNPLYFEPTRQSRKDNNTRIADLQKDFLEMLKTKLFEPDVIIFNAGMHLLHLTPMRTLRHETYASWVHYESLLDKLLQVGLDSGASALIAKSTNRICSDKFPNDLNRFVRVYHRGSSEGRNCQDFIETQEKDEQQKTGNESFMAFSESQRDEICKFGTFDESGSSLLNLRMSKWVHQTQIERIEQLALNDDSGRDSLQTARTNSNSRSRLQYFNDHDMESCDFTEERDGRHYMKLSLVRLHLLGILLNCILPG